MYILKDDLRNLLTYSDQKRICHHVQKEEEKRTYLQSGGPRAASIIEIRYNRMPVDSSSGRTLVHPLDIALQQIDYLKLLYQLTDSQI